MSLWEAKHAAVNAWCLGQLWDRFRRSAHSSFAIISAWRPDRPEQENHETDERLRSEITDYVPLVGKSQVTGSDGELRVLYEPFYWLHDLSFEEACTLAHESDQEFFVWCGPETEGTVCLFDRSGTVVERWPEVDPEAIAGAYGRWKGRPFFFEVNEQNFIGGMGRESFVNEYVRNLLLEE